LIALKVDYMIDGVVIAFADIIVYKKMEADLREKICEVPVNSD